MLKINIANSVNFALMKLPKHFKIKGLYELYSYNPLYSYILVFNINTFIYLVANLIALFSLYLKQLLY